MKETGTAHWNSPNASATNSSGFTALPGGLRNSLGNFSYLNGNAFFWSSSQYDYDTTEASNLLLNYSHGEVFQYSINRVDGASVRCLKND